MEVKLMGALSIARAQSDVTWSYICLEPVTKMIPSRKSFVCLLTDSEMANNFCLRYWARSPTGKWIESFQSLLSDSGLSKGEMVDMLKSACRLYFPHFRCDSCGGRLAVVTRSEYSSLMVARRRFEKGLLPLLCTSCPAAALTPKKGTDFFTLENSRDRLINALKRVHENAKPIDFAKLNFLQSCLLYAALVAANMQSWVNVIPPLEMQTEELAPTPELADEIYAQLCTDGIFLPALSSDLNAFSLEEETGAVKFRFRIGAWTLADDIFGRSIEEIISVLFQRLDRPW
jgi:hypothetical protein